MHYVMGLWITPAGYVLIYFFLPASVRNPIYSHRLSLIGFWSLAFFYPFVGIHHYLYSPIADWAETIAIVSSMMLIIPVWTVLQNFFGTMIGRWQGFSRNLPAKFLIVGSIMYLVGCFQGSLEALRSLQQPTHFTDFVIAHSHLTVFGTFVVWAIAGTVYVWPRLARDAPLWSFRVGNWGFWLITLGISAMGPESRSKQVSRAVRTDLGDVKWVRYDAVDYTPLERLGRGVYIREGCWYCHSQYVRPVTGEDLRWGPVSEAGEYAYDLPHLFSTRRIGPDLTRVGLKYADDWHYAHHWDPRLVVPESIMPSFKWLFEQARVPVRQGGDGLALEATPALSRYFTLNKDKPVLLFPNETGLTFVRPHPDGELPIDGTPVLDLTPFADTPPALTSVLLVVPTKELVSLVGYVQKLGTNRGAWREVFEPQNVALSVMGIPPSADLVARGEEEYAEHCIGCHGAKGDGNGLAATFLFPRPRDFTIGAFKFRSTPSGSLPTDGDLFRTVTRGVRWT